MHAQFDLLLPTAVDEALDVLAGDGECMPLAGGTNVLVDLRAPAIAPKTLMSLGKLADLRPIDAFLVGQRWIASRTLRAINNLRPTMGLL